MKASVTLPSSSLGPLYSSSMAAKRGPPRNPPRQLVTQGDNGDKLGCSQAPRGPPEDPKTLLVTLAGTPRPPQGPRGSLKTLQDPHPCSSSRFSLEPRASTWDPKAPPRTLPGDPEVLPGIFAGICPPQDPHGGSEPPMGPLKRTPRPPRRPQASARTLHSPPQPLWGP